LTAYSLTDDPQHDVSLIGRIDAIPTMLEVVCRTTGMGFAAVARVTDNRWIACSVRDEIEFGLQPGGELNVETTICDEIRCSGEPVIIDHVAEDAAFRDHHTPAMYGFQSYISMPIVLPDGTFFGTLCAIDPRPARLNRPEIIGMFKLFADLVAFHLDAQRRLTESEAGLFDARANSELREQFIAVLGHDLRNPLASIGAGTRMLRRTPLNEEAQSILTLIGNSVDRMAGLIDNVLDFARGRLGGGLTLAPDATEPLKPVLEQVVAELRAATPARIIESSFAFAERVHCDRVRIGQLLSNLVANAITYGSPDKPIKVRASADDETFKLSVTNAGAPIPAATMEQLFQPFFRAATRRSQQGLGLGLYIASEIARAHKGTLTVASTPEATCFTFRMPIG
jgi:signal transduction histidine kinase